MGSATPKQSTREGGTRWTGEGQHLAPRHAPHRHHADRTHPHSHPRHAASGPRQPAQRAGSREEGAPEPRRSPPPPWRAAPHRARGPQGRCRAPMPAHPPGEGERLTPDAPPNGERQPPGDALPRPPRRALPARNGAPRGAGAGSPRPHQPHLGHTGRGTLAA